MHAGRVVLASIYDQKVMAARIAVPALGAAFAVHLLRALLARWRSSRYGGLESLVSYSSRLIAAARAAESLRPDAFIVDPLAYILAGPQAMAKYKDDQVQKQANASSAADSSTASEQQPASDKGAHTDGQANAERQQAGKQQLTDNTPSQHEHINLPLNGQTPAAATAAAKDNQKQQQQRPVPRLIMRTVFFDDAVLAAVGNAADRSLAAMADVLRAREQRGLPSCRQVVLLGSGMDTRPWRLDLPPKVSWFEIDRHDVLKAKKAELQNSGAEFRPHSSSSHSSSSTSQTSSKAGTSNQTSAAQEGGTKQCFQLKAISWNCAAVDLQVPGWSKQLIKAGLDTSLPTAWVAEGLMYYLEPDCVAKMLQEVANVSAPGSILALNFMTESGLSSLREKLAARAAAAAADEAAENGKHTAAAGGTAAASSQVGGAKQKGSSNGSSRGKSSGLLKQFKWGCPDDCKQYLAEHGWDLMVCLPWTKAAVKYGWQPQEPAAGAAGRPSSHEVQFAIALRSSG